MMSFDNPMYRRLVETSTSSLISEKLMHRKLQKEAVLLQGRLSAENKPILAALSEEPPNGTAARPHRPLNPDVDYVEFLRPDGTIEYRNPVQPARPFGPEVQRQLEALAEEARRARMRDPGYLENQKRLRAYILGESTPESAATAAKAPPGSAQAPAGTPNAPRTPASPAPSPNAPGTAAARSTPGPAAAKPPASKAQPASSRLGTAGKVLGGAGVVAGAVGVYQGVGELKQGRILDGTATTTEGGLNAVGGAAALAGRVALGSALGGAAASVDGVHDLVTGIRSDDVEKTGVGTVKTAAGATMIAGAATANPILIGAGAVGYAGSLVYEHRGAIADRAVWAGRAVKDMSVWALDKLDGVGDQ